MNIIKPNVEIINEPGLLERIEIAGRTAYKSEDKICEGSAIKFFKSLVTRGHESVLEHSNIIIYAQNDETRKHLLAILQEYERDSDVPHFIRNSNSNKDVYVDGDVLQYDSIFSGNLRAWRSLVKRYCCEEVFIRLFFGRLEFEDIFAKVNPPLTELDYKETRYSDNAQAEILPWAPGKIHNIITARFTCSRGISHELVRHRLLSPTQESTRYCRYADLTVIEPWWYDQISMHNYDVHRATFLNSGLNAETNYKHYIDYGMSPQGARGCLNTDVKTEVVLTGTISAWERFLELRDEAGAHPDIRILAKMFREISGIDDWEE